MIPKTLHYIWLGGSQKSKLSQICIQNWKEKLLDFEIIEWNEQLINLDEIAQSNRFFAECRKRKFWAFTADYLRLKILYERGGVYFDTDIQIIRDITPLLDRPLLVGYEKDYKGDLQIGTGVIGCEKGNPVIKACLDFYEEKIWDVPFYTIPRVMEHVLGQFSDTEILPYRVLTPFAFNDVFDLSALTDGTYTVHWFEGTWAEKKEIRAFMKTKHINNPVKKRVMQFAQLSRYYIDKISNDLRERIDE